MIETLTPLAPYIFLAISLLLIVLLALIIISISSLEKKISTIPHIQLSDNLQGHINTLAKQVTALEQSTGKHTNHLQAVDTRLDQVYFSYVHRYNPFKESGVGGNQSFTAVFANKHGDGLLITSLYSREMNRVSSKPLTAWTNDEYSISPEEQFAIDQLKK